MEEDSVTAAPVPTPPLEHCVSLLREPTFVLREVRAQNGNNDRCRPLVGGLLPESLLLPDTRGAFQPDW